MKEKERILELVELGVISVEEATKLLERLAKKGQTTERVDDCQEDVDQLEEELEEQYEDKLDEYETKLDELEDEIDETDDKMDGLIDVISDLEDLDSVDSMATIQTLNQRLNQLKQEKESKKEKYIQLKQEYNAFKSENKKYYKEYTGDNFVSGLKTGLTKTVFNLVSQVSKAVTKLPQEMNNMMYSTEPNFEKEYVLDNENLSIIDAKMAAGVLQIERTDEPTIQVTLKAYFKKGIEINHVDNLFDEQAILLQKEDSVTLLLMHPDMKYDVTLYLPNKVYDYISIKIENGKLDIRDLHAKDVYAGVVNGRIKLTNVQAVVSELDNKNGGCVINKSDIRDLIATVNNGTIIVDSKFIYGTLKIINGSMKIAKIDSYTKKCIAHITTGSMKIGVVPTINLEGTTTSQANINLKQVIVNKNINVQKFSRQLTDDVLTQIEAIVDLGSVVLVDKEGE